MRNEIFAPEKQIICKFVVKRGKGKVITLNTKLVHFITALNWQSNNLHTPSYDIKYLKLKRKHLKTVMSSRVNRNERHFKYVYR